MARNRNQNQNLPTTHTVGDGEDPEDVPTDGPQNELGTAEEGRMQDIKKRNAEDAKEAFDIQQNFTRPGLSPEGTLGQSPVEHARDVKDPLRAAGLREDQPRAASQPSGPLARYEFRLMMGGHTGQDFSQPIIIDTTHNAPRADRRRPSKVYAPGDRVWDNADLTEHNHPNSTKFKLLRDWGPSAYTDGVDPRDPTSGRGTVKPRRTVGGEMDVPERKALEELSLGDLREMCAKNDVEIEGLTEKSEIINAMMRDARIRSKSERIPN